MTKKENRGGARQGSGAPLKYGEPMKNISIRVPLSRIEEIKELVKEKLANPDTMLINCAFFNTHLNLDKKQINYQEMFKNCKATLNDQ